MKHPIANATFAATLGSCSASVINAASKVAVTLLRERAPELEHRGGR